MTCPVCQNNQVIIKNGYYFCLDCNILICKVGSQKAVEIKKPIIEEPVIKDTPLRRFASFKLFLGIFLLIGFLLFARNFFYSDFSNGCYIFIGPSIFDLSNDTIKKGIVILKNAAPKNYRLLCDRVSFVNPNVSCGGFEGGCFYPDNPRTIDVSTSLRMLANTAEVIAHETCHAEQNHTQRPMSEEECYAAGSKVLKTIVEY